MSKYAEITTNLTSAEHLVAALKALGYPEVEVHKDPHPLYGFVGDERKETAHVIVRRKHVGAASNDLGFVRGSDGQFRAIISKHDYHKHNAQWLGNLKREYKASQTIAVARSKGYVFQGRQEIDGKTRLTFRAR